MEIAGRFFDAQRSLSRAARLSSTPEGLRLDVEGEAQARQPKLVRITEKLGALPRKLVFDDGSVFEASSDSPVDGLLPGQGRLLAAVARLEASWRIAVAAAIATVILLLGAYRYGLPLAALAAANITPTNLLELMNDGSLHALDTAVLGPSNLPRAQQAEIAKMFDELAAPLAGPLQLKLIFRDGGRIRANALALPGGTIVVTDQLVRLAQSDDEIAGVLAHEIGHVEERHSLQQIYRALGITALLALVGGDSAQLVHDAINQAAVLQTFAYSREFEYAADKRSVGIMVAAGRNPTAFIDLLDRIVPGDGDTSVMSTHPANRDRRAAAETQAKSLGWCAECAADGGQMQPAQQ